jgi:hypothetical protein
MRKGKQDSLMGLIVLDVSRSDVGVVWLEKRLPWKVDSSH